MKSTSCHFIWVWILTSSPCLQGVAGGVDNHPLLLVLLSPQPLPPHINAHALIHILHIFSPHDPYFCELMNSLSMTIIKKIVYRLVWTAQHASHQGSCLCFLSTSRSQLVFQLKFTESTCAKIAKHFAARNFFCTSFDWSQLLNDTIDFSNDWIPPPVPILKHFWVIKGINSESAKVHWSRSPKVNFLDSALQCHSDKVLVADVPSSPSWGGR